MSSNNNNMIIGIVILVVIAYLFMNSQPTVVVPIAPPTSEQTAEYIASLNQPTKAVAVIHALASGTGDKTILMQMFPLPATSVARYDKTTGILIPYSGGFNDAGFDDLGRFDVNCTWELDEKGGRWFTNSDNPQFMLQENFIFFADQIVPGEFSVVTDCNGAKQIPFAHHTKGENIKDRKITFGSFKVQPGTLMMITVWPLGSKLADGTLVGASGTPTYGFILNGRHCRDVIGYQIDPNDTPAQQLSKQAQMPGLLGEYKELTDGNNGIRWNEDIDAEWTITVLNKTYFRKYMLKKFNGCLDIAMGISDSSENPLNENQRLGLHYANGTKINNPTDPTKPQYGRWLYDYKCDPVVNPAGLTPGKQAYVTGGPGWGLTCQNAYDYCKLEPGLLVGIKLSDMDINDNGVPNFVGIEDTSLMGTKGVPYKRSQLSDTNRAWEFPTIDPVTSRPVSAIAAPVNAKSTLSNLATGAVAPPITIKTVTPLQLATSQFTSTPKSWLGRMSTMSHETMNSAPDGDSFTNHNHRGGNSQYHDPFAMMHSADQS